MSSECPACTRDTTLGIPGETMPTASTANEKPAPDAGAAVDHGWLPVFWFGSGAVGAGARTAGSTMLWTAWVGCGAAPDAATVLRGAVRLG